MNNPEIYNAVLCGIGGSTQALDPTFSAAGNYTAFGTSADAIATAVDALIPIYAQGPTVGQVTLISQIASGLEFNRFMTAGKYDAAKIATSIVSLYNALTPLLTNTSSIYSLFLQGKSTANTVLAADPFAAILVQVLTGFGSSKFFNVTIGYRAVIWETADKSNSGSVDGLVDLYITTDAFGVATCVLQTTPSSDVTRLPTGLAGAGVTIAPSAGGFTISAQRKAGLACTAFGYWWIASKTEL